MFSRDYIRNSMLLYGVTDSSWLKGRSLTSCVESAIAGGATFIQLREKNATTAELVELGKPLQQLCRRAGIPFVIDDDIEAARILGADGVHVGQEDQSCAIARAALGSDAIVGVSTQTVEQAKAAQLAGATYLGVGAIFGTPTKPEAVELGCSGLAEICAAVDIPVVAIGGLNAQTIGQLKGSGADGAAVVSAIFAADNIEAATKQLRLVCEETF